MVHFQTQNNSIELRKIQFSGKTSYMLALPKKWVEEVGLRQGDKVSISRQSNKSLLITLQDVTSPSSGMNSDRNTDVAVQLLAGKDDFSTVVRKIISLYLAGYSRIHVAVAGGGRLTVSQRTVIKDAIRRHLMGTEVVSDNEEGISLQVLLGRPQMNLKDALSRMHLVAASMHTDAIDALERHDEDLVESVMENDDDVDRFGFYVSRQLNIALQGADLPSIGFLKSFDVAGHLSAINLLENIADQACRAALQAGKISETHSFEPIVYCLKRLDQAAMRLVGDAVSALFNLDYRAAEGVASNAKLFMNEIEKEFWTIGGTLKVTKINSSFIENLLHLTIIFDCVKRTAECAGGLAEVVLNMTVERAIVQKQEPQPINGGKMMTEDSTGQADQGLLLQNHHL
jgi:phosphate uptake regulator